MSGCKPSYGTVSPLEEGSEGYVRGAAEEAVESRQQELGEGQNEGRINKGFTLPKMPEWEVIENHNLTHVPFRDWCVHCIRGRAVNLAHCTKCKEQQEAPVISMDYMWMKGKEGVEAGDNPIMVMTDRRSKCRSACLY